MVELKENNINPGTELQLAGGWFLPPGDFCFCRDIIFSDGVIVCLS